MDFLIIAYENVHKFLSTSVMVQIYSSPMFAIETIIGALMCLVNILLVVEVDRIQKRLNFIDRTRLKLQKSLNSEENYPSTGAITHPDFGVKVIFQNDVVKIKQQWLTKNKINQILAITPDEFIKRDMLKLKYELDGVNEANEREVFERFLQPEHREFIYNDDNFLWKTLNYLKTFEIHEMGNGEPEVSTNKENSIENGHSNANIS